MKTVLDVLVTKYEEEVAAMARSLSGGVAKDFAEYREICGKIRGLTLAMSIIDDLARNMEDDDD